MRLGTILTFSSRLAIGELSAKNDVLARFLYVSACLMRMTNENESPLMAEQLSYLRSQSHSYVYAKQNKRVSSADENYAREVMQLFSSKRIFHKIRFALPPVISWLISLVFSLSPKQLV